MPAGRARALVALILLGEALALLGPMLLDRGVPAPLNHIYAHDLAFRQDLERLARDPDFLRLPIHAWTGDVATMFLPWYERVRAALREGRVPLWEPDLLCGYAIHANWQLAPFEPTALPTYLLPVWLGMCARLLLRLLVGSSGMYRLARGQGISRPGSVLAASVFSLSAPTIGWLSYPLGATAVWLPWMLHATLKLARRGAAGDVALLALSFAASCLSGHVETTFLSGVAGAVVLAWRLRGRGLAASLRPLALGALALLLGAGSAAVQVLPFEQALRISWLLQERKDREPIGERIRAGLAGRKPLLRSLGREGGTVFFPAIGGSALRQQWPEPRKSPPTIEEDAYVGLPTLALALAALLLAGRGVRPLALATLLALAVGLQLPLADLVNLLPIFELMPVERWRFVWAVGMALLAGIGLDALPRASALEARRWRLACLALGGYGLLHVGAVAGWLERTGRGLATRGEIGLAVAALALLPVLAAALARLRSRGPWPAALALGAVAVDLLGHGRGVNTYVLEEHAAIEPGVVRFLRAQPGPFRIGRLDRAALIPNLALRFGLEDALGYDAVYPWWVRDLWAVEDPLSAVHDLRGERFLIGRAGAGAALPAERFRKVFGDGAVEVHENLAVLPRAFLVGRVARLESDAAVLGALARADFRHALLTADPALGEAGGGPGDGPLQGEARIAHHQAERVLVEVRASRAGHLVLLDTYDPGWSATVDGRPAAIHRVNHAFRAVAVPPGESRVEMRYDPARWRWGKRYSLASLALLAALLLAGAARRRGAGGR